MYSGHILVWNKNKIIGTERKASGCDGELLAFTFRLSVVCILHRMVNKPKCGCKNCVEYSDGVWQCDDERNNLVFLLEKYRNENESELTFFLEVFKTMEYKLVVFSFGGPFFSWQKRLGSLNRRIYTDETQIKISNNVKHKISYTIRTLVFMRPCKNNLYSQCAVY